MMTMRQTTGYGDRTRRKDPPHISPTLFRATREQRTSGQSARVCGFLSVRVFEEDMTIISLKNNVLSFNNLYGCRVKTAKARCWYVERSFRDAAYELVVYGVARFFTFISSFLHFTTPGGSDDPMATTTIMQHLASAR